MVTPPDEGKDRFDIFAQSHHGQPNHVLINEYPPGTGIMPHTDGPAYYPVVATVSLGASIILDVHEKASDGGLVRTPQYRILQEPRSLLITTDKLYTDYFHGISDAEKDDDLGSKTIANWEQLGNQDQFSGGSYRRETRVSLTFRDVPQVVKPSKLFPGLSAKGW
jgi:alkylated DNA repair protein alkB family protein 6